MFPEKQLLVAVTVACVLLAGCAGIGPLETDDDPSVDHDAVVETAAETESYTVTVDRTLQSPTVVENTSLSGTIDRTGQSAHIESTTEVDVGGGPQTSDLELYVREDYQYTATGDDWERTPLEDDVEAWSEIDRLETAADSLEDDEYVPLRTETVDGTETTMFEVEVPEDRWDDLAGVTQDGHTVTSVEQLVYYVYVDTDTDTLYGTDLRMEVTQGDGSAFVTIETLFGGYDDDLDVSLPDAAEDAETTSANETAAPVDGT
ncbi:hypothetical protein [Natrarchaeobaculum aegyptiacum]|uniref:LppX_LprAFG lipoprotein n=1 Tax=Natrarchaeobaculum aegyptiacum TaxID=745377 RepID=A0A2Z2HYQ4_9EURY|nr:hypothetical protein [Natrarchaeobaculum aegyptiacum]ARS90957.1 hypothetical protein B1756_15275 [Natrarchaeobaculum aegyptiacum]